MEEDLNLPRNPEARSNIRASRKEKKGPKDGDVNETWEKIEDKKKK